jgi:hypothetical protein
MSREVSETIGQATTTRRGLAIDPTVANAPSEQAPGSRVAQAGAPRPSRPDLALTLLSSRAAEGVPTGGMPQPRPADDAAAGPLDANAWRKLPKGIALGVLLAIPFWVALAVWLLR